MELTKHGKERTAGKNIECLWTTDGWAYHTSQNKHTSKDMERSEYKMIRLWVQKGNSVLVSWQLKGYDTDLVGSRS